MKKSHGHCPVSGKVSFSSESSAQRRVNRYGDITRAYYCEDCDGYHITSQALPEKDGSEQKKFVSGKKIAARIKELTKK